MESLGCSKVQSLCVMCVFVKWAVERRGCYCVFALCFSPPRVKIRASCSVKMES